MSQLDKEELMRRYRDRLVECDDEDVRLLNWLLSLFFAKCDNLLSGSEVKKLMGNLGAIPFDPYVTSADQEESVLIRLRFLKKYRINTPKEIISVLTQGLFSTERLNPSDRRYLVEFTENPDKPFKWFADKLNVTVSSVFEAYQRLRKTIQFHFECYLNYPLFRLKHFVLFFKPNESFKSSALTKKEFVLSINRDTFGDWMWTSFVVPNQERILREFDDGVRRFARGVFHEHRLYEVKSFLKHCNLSMFDGEKWIVSEEALGVGAFKYAQAGEEVSPRPGEFMYGDKPIRFDGADFLVTHLRMMDARTKNSSIKEILKQNNYDLSLTTISKKLTALKRAGVFYNTFNFSGLELKLALVFAVECSSQILETFYHMFPMFPECVASRTDKGVIFMVRSTAEAAPAISYLMRSLKDEVDDLIATSRLENIGRRLPVELHKYWNEKQQYWEFKKGYFDLTRSKSQDMC